MAIFQFFKMAAVHHLGFLQFEILPAVIVCRVSVPNVKFCAYRSNRFGGITILKLFKMAAVRHLGFLEGGNFNGRSGLEGHYASPCQIL